MNLIKTSFLLIALFFSSQAANSQVAKTVIVEHFTNSRCSICANSNKNPAFYTNLADHPEALHISYHPSSPYSNCFFSLSNPSENDDRAKYYNTFGSTPDLIVQGVLNPSSTPFGSADVFSPYLDQMSEVSIEIIQTKTVDEKIEATVIITTESAHNYTGVNLLVAVAEKLVEYNAPNGENEHRDVFRKALTDIEGDVIELPAVGESISFTYTLDNDASWDFSEMFVYAILNDAENKQVIQADAASPSENTTATYNLENLAQVNVYPNPTSDVLHIELINNVQADIRILNVAGTVVFQKTISTTTQIDVSDLNPGIYFLHTGNRETASIQKVIIE